MTSILVFDFGTSSLKAVVFGADARIIAEADAPYPTRVGAGGHHEQDPADWRRALVEVCATLGDRLAGIALIVLAGTMQSVIPVDAAGDAIGPAMLYSDSRAEAGFAAATAKLAGIDVAGVIGNPPDAYMAAFKLAWLRDHDRDRFDRAATFHSGSKDVVAQWLTGAIVTDATAATTTGLMDLAAGDWHPGLLGAFDIARQRLPAIHPADAIIGTLGAGPAATLGLVAGTPVLNGCGDAGASTLGAGIAAPGETYVYVGTTAWAAQIARRGEHGAGPAQSIYTLAHPTRTDAVICIGAMLSGGDSVAWYAGTGGHSVAALDTLLDGGVPDSRALFLPYLKGERCPFMDPDVRGGFLLLDRADTAASLHHAVLESIALAIAANIDGLGPVTGALALIGGGAVSRHLPQLIADACDRSVTIGDGPAAATAFGAFALAAAQLGWPVARPAAGNLVRPRAERREHAAGRRQLFAEATRLARSLARFQPSA